MDGGSTPPISTASNAAPPGDANVPQGTFFVWCGEPRLTWPQFRKNLQTKIYSQNMFYVYILQFQKAILQQY